MNTVATRLLKIAARSLRAAKQSRARRRVFSTTQQDCAAVAVIMCAAAVECCVQVRTLAPLLEISPPRLQKYIAGLVGENVRAPILQRLKFLASIDPRLKLPKEDLKVLAKLFSHRNRLVHSSLAHRELRFLPDDWNTWVDIAFEVLPKRASLEFMGWDSEIADLATMYYGVAQRTIMRYESIPLSEKAETAP